MDVLVPLASGSTESTEDMVTPDLKSEYWLVPALKDTQCFPTFFACAALIPKIVVSPEELPLM